MSHAWQLVIQQGPEKGRKFIIHDDVPLVIGRGSDSDTKIRDPKISRVHCEIRIDNQTPILVDRGGSGGTLVDGQEIDQSLVLNANSLIQIGQSVLRVEAAELDQETLHQRPIDDVLPPAESIAELVGHTLHHYRLDELVTKGRNSVIFKGTDTKRDTRLAIKVLIPDLAGSDEQRERFIRAMKTFLPVKHPNIVRLRNAGRKGIYCWAAMEWVEGTSAEELIESIGIGGTLDWREVYRCGLHIARALVAASEFGIVHRNITPANILRDDENRRYLLSDLVLAKALENTEAPQLTKPGDIIGEIGYLAPERVLDASKLDTRSDFYGLGATLYALLTGQSPYPSHSVAEWLEATSGDPPARPVASQIGMDERFSDLVMRLIAKDPADRFANATEVEDDLKRVGTFAGIDVADL